jgi:hypothetical protein
VKENWYNRKEKWQTRNLSWKLSSPLNTVRTIRNSANTETTMLSMNLI